VTATGPPRATATGGRREERTPSALCLRHLDDDNMVDVLFRPEDGKPVLVDCYTTWCGPCKLIEPYVERASIREDISVVKYDVEADGTSGLRVELLLRGIRVEGLPTLLLFKDGKLLAENSGMITEDKLERFINTNISYLHFSSGPSEEKKTEIETMLSDESGGAGRRGLVSMTSRFEGDDYMLKAD